MSSPRSAGFALFAPTADTGIHAWGPTLPAVFRESARALFSLLVEAESVRCEEWLPVTATGEEPEALLVAWLNELLFLFETRRFAAGDCRICSLGETAVLAEVGGETIDPSRHRLVGQVKAVTYHDLVVRRAGAGWEARVVVDV